MRKPFFAGGGFSMTGGRNTKGAWRRAGKSPPSDAAGLTGAPHGLLGGLCGGGRCGGLGGRLGTTSRLRKSTGAWRWPCQGAGGATYTGFGGGGGGFGGRLSPRGGRAGGARMPRRQFWSLSAVDIVDACRSLRGGVQGVPLGELVGCCRIAAPVRCYCLPCTSSACERCVTRTQCLWAQSCVSIQRRGCGMVVVF